MCNIWSVLSLDSSVMCLSPLTAQEWSDTGWLCALSSITPSLQLSVVLSVCQSSSLIGLKGFAWDKRTWSPVWEQNPLRGKLWNLTLNTEQSFRIIGTREESSHKIQTALVDFPRVDLVILIFMFINHFSPKGALWVKLKHYNLLWLRAQGFRKV